MKVLALCPGATETEFFARTGEDFLTDGRQTPQEVVDTAMAALDKSGLVVSGWKNSLLASGTASRRATDAHGVRAAAQVGQLARGAPRR